jgi:putative membrane protein
MKSKWTCAMLLGCTTAMAGVAMAQTDQDKAFLGRASQGDYNEIKLSQLAVDKSQNPQVKAFAQKMVTDHTNLEQQMAPFAQKWGVTPASSLDPQHQAMYDKLNGLSGKDFDKQYIEDMDQDHHTTLTDFQTEEQTTKDQQFKTQVKSGEKVIAEHTKMADHLDRKRGMTPGGTDTNRDDD